MTLEAFSYSRLDNYESCPKKYFKISVEKSVKDPPNEHTTYGTDLHLAFAEYLKTGKPLPLHLRQWMKTLATIKASPGEKIIEQKIAINANYEPTDWFAKDVYCRVISDLTILNGAQGILWDWKTGKMKEDFSQLKLAGAVMFLLAEELEEVQLCYLWTKDKKVTKEKLTRDEMPTVWADLLPRIERYQNAHAQNIFEARPGFHCRYCPVKTCPHNEKK